MDEVRKLVETVVFSIVDNADRVRIVESTTEEGVYFEITVSKEDVGKLIGKGGRVAGALRTIAKASGAKNGIRVLTNVMNTPLD